MIRKLANEQLAVVASYLPSTSAACFAVAMSTPSSSPGELSGVFGDELDFTNMTELYPIDVLRDVLLSIDAKNTLKILRIEGCIHIIGHGLEPLRESTVLEQLDLPRFGNVLSIDIIIPLIISMRSRYLYEGNYYPCLWQLLHKLRFPEEWTRGRARNDQAHYQELERINQLIPEKSNITICFGCYTFSDELRRCQHCRMTLCDHGSGSCGEFKFCEGSCHSSYCSACAELDDVDAAVCCGGWSAGRVHEYCSACAPESTKCIECNECVALHQLAPKLLAKNEEKAAEIVEMRNNIDALTNENEQLRKEIEELRKRKRDD